MLIDPRLRQLLLYLFFGEEADVTKDLFAAFVEEYLDGNSLYAVSGGQCLLLTNVDKEDIELVFYDLQELVRHSPLLRKYYYLFKALNLSALPDRNYGVGATGHSRHAILRATR